MPIEGLKMLWQSLPAADDKTFVQALYRSYLGRSGRTDELQHWVDLLVGGWTREQVENAIYNSDEARIRREKLMAQRVGAIAPAPAPPPAPSVPQAGPSFTPPAGGEYEVYALTALAAPAAPSPAAVAVPDSTVSPEVAEAQAAFTEGAGRSPTAEEQALASDLLLAGWNRDQVRTAAASAAPARRLARKGGTDQVKTAATSAARVKAPSPQAAPAPSAPLVRPEIKWLAIGVIITVALFTFTKAVKRRSLEV